MRFVNLAAVAAAAIALSSAHGAAEAQAKTFQDLFGEKGNAELFTLKTDFPTSPAFAVLDEDPAPLQNIRNFEDLGTQIMSGVDSNGSLIGEGLSFGGRPFWWGDRSGLTLKSYSEGSYWARLYQRSHVSVASIKSESASGSDIWRMGLAVTTELLDAQDIRVLDKSGPSLVSIYQGCVDKLGASFVAQVNAANRDALRKGVDAVKEKFPRLNLSSVYDANGGLVGNEAQIRLAISNATSSAAEDQAATKVLDSARDAALTKIDPGPAKEAHEACVAVRAKELQLRPSIRVGIGHALTSTTSKLDDFQGEAVSVWISGRQPTPSFINNSSLTGFVQYDTDRQIKYETAGAPAGAVVEGLAKGDRLQANIGLAVVTDDFTLAGSAGYVDIDFNNSALIDDDYTLISISASKQLKPGMWLEFSLGSSDSSRLNESEFINLRLKFDWSQLGK